MFFSLLLLARIGPGTPGKGNARLGCILSIYSIHIYSFYSYYLFAAHFPEASVPSIFGWINQKLPSSVSAPKYA